MAVDARGARYPLRIDPFIQQGEKLTGGEEDGKGQFGYSVALSSDGNTALIGGYADNGAVGAAWVFTRSGGVWTQQGSKLTGGGEAGKAGSASSVALSSDGNTRADRRLRRQRRSRRGVGVHPLGRGLVPAGREAHRRRRERRSRVRLQRGALLRRQHRADRRLPRQQRYAGAAWVFTRSGSTWTQQGAKLTGGEENGAAMFGTSVALSSDGNTALIGGHADNGAVGAAWVFTRSGGVWTQQGPKLTGRRARRRRPLRPQRRALLRRQHRADRRRSRQRRRRRGVGVHPLGRGLVPAGPEAHGRRREQAQASSAAAWRSPPTATPR